jgi:hypothetical protein
MYQQIKKKIHDSFYIYNVYLFLRNRIFWVNWLRLGKPVPPPHFVKQRCVIEYGKRFDLPTLVETGTFRGDMVRAVRSKFREIYTIEIGQTLSTEAERLFAPFPHIHVMHGDSARVLPNVLFRIKAPCLFWLDAHYSGEGTSIGDQETPVLTELEIIFQEHVNNVILIDDARCFDGKNAYPAIDKIEACVLEHHPEWICEVRDDIIRIHPPYKHV